MQRPLILARPPKPKQQPSALDQELRLLRTIAKARGLTVRVDIAYCSVTYYRVFWTDGVAIQRYYGCFSQDLARLVAQLERGQPWRQSA